MTDRLALATRTKRARHTSTCPACRGPILVGMTIARLASPPAWIHVRCVPAVARVIGPHPEGTRQRSIN
jgi:hypothetical protein